MRGEALLRAWDILAIAVLGVRTAPSLGKNAGQWPGRADKMLTRACVLEAGVGVGERGGPSPGFFVSTPSRRAGAASLLGEGPSSEMGQC